MESLTKREVGLGMIGVMVRRAFDTAVSPHHITPLTAGWFNTAHLPWTRDRFIQDWQLLLDSL